MKRLDEYEREEVRDLLVNGLRRLLMFYVSHGALRFVHDESVVRWRELEDRLHENYAIKGAGIKATRENLHIIDSFSGGFLHTEEDLFPGDIPEELGVYPYAAASAAYTFTLLEGLGNELIGVVNPGYLAAKHRSWHHAVYADTDFTDEAQTQKARKGFAKPFDRSPSRVPVYAVERLAWMKSRRNAITHEGFTNIVFEEFFAGVVGTVAFLYFFVFPREKVLAVYPYADLEGKYR